MEKESHVVTSQILPLEFVSKIEHDLNKIAEHSPDYLKKTLFQFAHNYPYSDAFEFLVGWCIGNCEGSYIQGYYQVYEKFPSDDQIKEIRKIIARRRMQIEQAVKSVLESYY